MKIQMRNNLKNKTGNAGGVRPFSGSLVMPETVCCPCCSYGTGGNLFCR